MWATIKVLRRPARGEQVLAHATVGRTVRMWPSIIRDYTREVYRQRSHWSLAIALGAAIAIYANVIVIVGLNSRPIAAEAPFSELILEVVLESGPPEPIQAQQPDEEPLVAEAPPPSAEPFVEEAATPPPQPHRVRRSRSPAPRARTGAVGGVPGGGSMSSGGGSMSSGKDVRIYTPRPPYSQEARRNHITGSGIAEMTVDTATGAVTNVVMAQSTGNAMLDTAATSTFRRWRFRAGTVARVRQRITFALTGASY